MLGGCGDPFEPGHQPDEREVVARVRGEVVLLADLAAEVEGSGDDPREALDRLVNEALLVAEARGRGVELNERVAQQTRVYALLEDIEAANTIEAVGMDAVRSEYDATVERVAGQGVVVPPFDESVAEIRGLLVGRARLEALQELIAGLPAPTRNEARWDELLGLVQPE